MVHVQSSASRCKSSTRSAPWNHADVSYDISYLDQERILIAKVTSDG
jgi:hypothetical protein